MKLPKVGEVVELHNEDERLLFYVKHYDPEDDLFYGIRRMFDPITGLWALEGTPEIIAIEYDEDLEELKYHNQIMTWDEQPCECELGSNSEDSEE